MNILQKIFSPMKESKEVRGAILRGMVYPVVSSITAISSIEVMKRIIEALEVGNETVISNLLLVLLLLILITLLIRYITRYWGYPQIRPYLSEFLMNKFLKKFILLDNTSVEKIGTGRVQHIITSGVDSWTNALLHISQGFFGQLAKVVFSTFLVFSINIYYGFGYLLIIVITIYGYVYGEKFNQIYRRSRKEMYVEYNRDIIRIIMSKFEILQNSKIDSELGKMIEYIPKWYGFNKLINFQKARSDIVSISLLEGIKVICIILVSYSTFLGNISLAEFLVLIMIVGILSEVSRKLSRLYIDTTNELPNIEKLLELFENTGSIEGFDSGSKFTFKKGNIKLDSLSFSYTNNSGDVLSNLTIDIEGGKKTALVGPSGSGKTTLVKLITGYIRPDSGSIIVDGQDLTQVSLKSYYKHIGYLTQEPSVFDGTIRENLLYAVESDSLTTNEGISQAPCPMDIPLLKGEEKGVCNGRSLDDRLTQAIKSSQCEFIYDLPNGLDTEIGERGVRLSGGQRQRLAIAKIFLKNPEIIILDEPTSALDSFSEEAITVAMNELFKDRTVVIIAHRLQTVKHADDIILLDQGEVLERGTHAELVNQGGQYAKMLELQSGF